MEGILPAREYHQLFETAVEEYGQDNIHSYYYDLPFEETMLRHSTKPNRNEFGEADMRRWWIEKYYLDIIPQTKYGETSWSESLTHDRVPTHTGGRILPDLAHQAPYCICHKYSC